MKTQKTTTVLLFSIILTACADSNSESPPHSSNNRSTPEAVVIQQHSQPKSIESQFSKFATIDTERAKNSWALDFDGDQRMDTLVAVKFLSNNFPPDLTLTEPWELMDAGSEKGSQFGFILKSGASENITLIRDKNTLSILDTEAAKETLIVSHKNTADLNLPELSRAAKGDIIVIPTEAGIDTYLYWDGKTVNAYEPIEIP